MLQAFLIYKCSTSASQRSPTRRYQREQSRSAAAEGERLREKACPICLRACRFFGIRWHRPSYRVNQIRTAVLRTQAVEDKVSDPETSWLVATERCSCLSAHKR